MKRLKDDIDKYTDNFRSAGHNNSVIAVVDGGGKTVSAGASFDDNTEVYREIKILDSICFGRDK